MKNKINLTQNELTKKLMAIEETGPTALGPAIATSIAMAAEGAPGSQVVICTDGLANIGLGAFDEAKTPEEIQKVEEFYERIGEYAKSKGLTLNIVSIIGDECNLESLSKLAEITGGNVERVDPVSLTKNFANILS
jgi:Mg-chelatase subunit ChlD